MKFGAKVLLIIILLIISIVIGYFAGKGGLFSLIQLGVVSTIMLALTLLGGIIDIFYKRNLFKYFGLAFLWLAVALLTASTMYGIKVQKKKNTANKIIDELEASWQVNGVYPKSLEKVYSSQALATVKYKVANGNSEFTLWYTTDSGKKRYYESDSGKWNVEAK